VISKPTNRQLIDAVCAELSGKVLPTITDGGTKVVMEMALSILACAAVRTNNELAWMKEETDAIEAVARRFVEEMPEADALSSALAAFDAGRTGSLYIDAAQADYELISEVLSCATDAAFASGDTARIAAVEELLGQRMANENAVTGTFLAVGRT
jgi:hypothetical protein